MAKRKRADVPNDVSAPGPTKTKKTKPSAAAAAAAAAAATAVAVAAPQENGKKIIEKNTNSKKAKATPAPTTTIPAAPTTTPGQPVTIQIVTGSYDRILHGITVTLTPEEDEKEEEENGKASSSSGYGSAEFADTFLFNAHSSAIRCLALSPPSAPEPGRGQKVMLASGGNDERINVYNISAHPPKRWQSRHEAGGGSNNNSEEGGGGEGRKNAKAPPSMNDVLSSIAPRRILEDPRNRELGTLLHHSASVTRLAFPTRSKLLSASEDCTVAVTRTRDWALLSAIRAPAPKPHSQHGGGAAPRPSGDTAAPGAGPHGVSDFAVHPSMKLMITVGRGERCMRLWNLMTAKKAGVLNFGRDVLAQVGEGRHGLGEGRRVVWGVATPAAAGTDHNKDEDGDEEDEDEEEFCVEFDRDLLVFGMDSTPKCRVMPDHRRKVHEVRYVVADPRSGTSLLAVSTEDGHVLFFSTRSADLTVPAPQQQQDSAAAAAAGTGGRRGEKTQQQPPLPVAKLVAQLGGRDAGVTGRIKDFTVLRVPSPIREEEDQLIIPTGGSDGKVRVFAVSAGELNEARRASSSSSSSSRGAGSQNKKKKGEEKEEEEGQPRRVGRLLGTYDTSNRITCLEAFVMTPRPASLVDDDDDDSEGEENGDEEFEDFSAAEEEGDGDSDSA